MNKKELEMLDKLNRQKAEINKLTETIKIKNKVINQLTFDNDFLRKRVVSLYGRDTLKTLLNCVENKAFDPKGFDEVSKKKGSL